jgi:hypothetical protein
MRVPLATADEKGYEGGSTTARRRSIESRATSLPTVGPGCSEAPPSGAPHRGSTQERCCMKRVSRAGSSRMEVHDGRGVYPLRWTRRAHQDRRSVPHHEYGGSGARAGDPDLRHEDRRPVAVPGRKTDGKDTAWIADLLRHGLLRGSFIPSKPPRPWRELTRSRSTLVQAHARALNRWQAV